jgi:flagellar motor switch protein FliM
VAREITEIEQSILDSVFRIILHDLKEAWHPVATIGFAVEQHETEPQLLQILAPNEAVVAVGFEIRIGDISGMMNLGIPSIIIKMLRQRFDQQWSMRKGDTTEENQTRLLNLIQNSEVKADARLSGPTLSMQDLMALEEDEVLCFDYPVDRPLDLFVNGQRKFKGEIVTSGRKRGFRLKGNANEV